MDEQQLHLLMKTRLVEAFHGGGLHLLGEEGTAAASPGTCDVTAGCSTVKSDLMTNCESHI